MSSQLKVEFVDNASSQYDDNACSLKLKSSASSKGKLFIGDKASMSFVQVKHRQIRAVVCCHPDLYGYCKEANVVYHKVYPTEDFTTKGNVTSREQTLQFIQKQLSTGKNVLIACQSGLTVSAVVAIAYLMQLQEYTLIDAYEHVESRRGDSLKVSYSLAQMLLEMEKSLFKVNTMHLEDKKLVSKNKSSNDSSSSSKEGKNSSKKAASPAVSGTSIMIGLVAAVSIIYGCLYLATGKM